MIIPGSHRKKKTRMIRKKYMAKTFKRPLFTLMLLALSVVVVVAVVALLLVFVLAFVSYCGFVCEGLAFEPQAPLPPFVASEEQLLEVLAAVLGAVVAVVVVVVVVVVVADVVGFAGRFAGRFASVVKFAGRWRFASVEGFAASVVVGDGEGFNVTVAIAVASSVAVAVTVTETAGCDVVVFCFSPPSIHTS